MWANPGTAGAAEPLSSIPLEYAWERLAYIQPYRSPRPEQLRWQYYGADEQNTFDPANAIAEAIIQNAPVHGATEGIVLSIPNHLDEPGQDDLIGSLQAQGLFNVRLLWRPIALAFSWAQEKSAAASALADNNHALWVIDLESRGLEITQLRWKRHNDDPKYVCPVRSYPRRNDCEPSWSSWKWADEIAQGICGEDGSAKSLLWGVAGADFQRFLEGVKHGSLVFQSKSDARRWAQANPEPIRQSYTDRWVAELIKALQARDLQPGDHVLLHGWPARHVSEVLARRLMHPVDVSRPTAVSEGAAFFAERVHARLPTYYDTLPQYAIWASLADNAGQRTFTWKALNPVSVSVIDAGKEWILSKQEDPELIHLCEDTFRLARHIDRFSLLIQNKTQYDEDQLGANATGSLLGKRLAVDLPTTTIQQVPLRIEMLLRPASGHAKFTIASKEGLPVFEDKDSVALSWKAAEDEPEHKGYLEAREVVGRIMDKPEYRELTRLITRKLCDILLPPKVLTRLQKLLDDYRPGNFDVVEAGDAELLQRVLVPWGYTANPTTSQPTRGLWGSRREYNDPELDQLAQLMGDALLGRARADGWQSENSYKFLNCMFVYAPSQFLDIVRKEFQPGHGAEHICHYSQAFAPGRVCDDPRDFEAFIRFLLQSGFKYPAFRAKYWWSFFRCLCYHKNTSQVDPILVRNLLMCICNYFEGCASPLADERKFALHALLFALRLRGNGLPLFLPCTDALVPRFNHLIVHGRLAGEDFPKAMLAGMSNMVAPGDNFSKYVWRFLNFREDLADRELGSGLATS